MGDWPTFFLSLLARKTVCREIARRGIKQACVNTRFIYVGGNSFSSPNCGEPPLPPPPSVPPNSIVSSSRGEGKEWGRTNGSSRAIRFSKNRIVITSPPTLTRHFPEFSRWERGKIDASFMRTCLLHCSSISFSLATKKNIRFLQKICTQSFFCTVANAKISAFSDFSANTTAVQYLLWRLCHCLFWARTSLAR